MEILEKLSLIFLPVLLAAFFISIIPRKLEERRQFNKAIVEFRKVFNQALVEVRSERCSFEPLVSADSIKTHYIAWLNFRSHLHRIYHYQYDKAWHQYCFDCESLNSHWDIEKDIKSLLEFTKNRRLYNMFFLWKRLWLGLRLKVLGPDKKTKEIVKKLLKIYQNKNLLS